MITITPQAADQIRRSAEQSDAKGLALRIAARRLDDGSIDYGMGFDDQRRDDDTRITSDGVEVVISGASKDLLTGATLDYVELNPGEFHFIFINPNDPQHKPPLPA
ncbi:adhesin [Sulfurifustis variabilis]|uniref:Adhesin n=1 Tax=Sulfurifustis variabilis TaxID=1675686 RepID=A0A1B4V4S6_9GAMM|nr:iron-sulfur cluster assembly accessory protein [Sulfurifustis variabilis]BAU48520.1 adhesin [Sulfurifustis variabilis]